jgi:hypothetical protein
MVGLAKSEYPSIRKQALLYIHSEEAPVRRLGQCFEKFGGFYSERACQRNDVYDGDIPFASFDSTYVIAMQVREFS